MLKKRKREIVQITKNPVRMGREDENLTLFEGVVACCAASKGVTKE